MSACNSKQWVGAMLAAMVLAAPARGGEDRSVEQRVAAEPNGEVFVNVVTGDLKIEGWDHPEVEVTGTIGSGVERLDVVRDGRRVTVKPVLPKLDVRDADADLSIRVPRGSLLEVTTVSADAEVRDVAGPLRLKSVSGEITARAVAQDSEFKSVSGDIHVVAGPQPAKLTAYSVSGSLVIDDLSGELEATTVSGDMGLDLDTIDRLRMRTTSGDARVGGRLAKAGQVEFESISGDLSLKVGAEAGFIADVDTFSGSLSNCFGVRSEPVSKYGPGERMSVTRGEGGARIRAKTMSGDVRVCDR